MLATPLLAASAVTEKDINAIAADLRCLTCPNENIAESATPMAQDVKRYIYERLEAGDSKEAIIKTLTDRYGEELRYKPLWASHTILLWLTPVLCIVIGILLLSRLFKRRA
jgi:cytochrome c-type biogenesis protein CcmH